jgi:hypothetical protein
MKYAIVAAALIAPFAVSAQNLLGGAGQGTFAGGLGAWTSLGGGLFPAAVINTLPATGTAFGENVAADPLVAGSPDAGGTTALYFVDDSAVQTVSRDFTTGAAMTHNWGFDYWVPANGLANGNAVLTTSILLGNAVVATNVFNIAAPPQTWIGFASTFAANAQTTYTFRFSFVGNGFPSEDIVVDRAFVTAVPEPTSYAMMAAGLLAVGFMAARRRKQD